MTLGILSRTPRLRDRLIIDNGRAEALTLSVLVALHLDADSLECIILTFKAELRPHNVRGAARSMP